METHGRNAHRNAGLAGGAVVGTIFPVVGTVIGAVIGGALGQAKDREEFLDRERRGEFKTPEDKYANAPTIVRRERGGKYSKSDPRNLFFNREANDKIEDLLKRKYMIFSDSSETSARKKVEESAPEPTGDDWIQDQLAKTVPPEKQSAATKAYVAKSKRRSALPQTPPPISPPPIPKQHPTAIEKLLARRRAKRCQQVRPGTKSKH